MMALKIIPLPVDANIARLYEDASPETQRKVQTLFQVLMREMISADAMPLNELMDTISDRAQARGLPRDFDPFALEEMMETTDMREFVDDDAGYLHWVDTNPTGYVINAPKRRGDFPDMLHRASCTHITTRQRTNYTTTDFMKVCSLDKQSLIDWGARNSDDFRKCQSCKP